MSREHDGLAGAPEALEDAAEPIGLHVCLTVDCGGDEAARRELQRLEDARTLPGDRRESQGRVGHHVADDLDPTADSLRLERAARALVRTEEQGRNAVDLDPVALLGHREVAASKARLDMRKRNAGRLRRIGARECGVRVSVDKDPIGPCVEDGLEDRRQHRVGVGRLQFERVPGLPELELVEEHPRQLVVVVLARVEHDLVDMRRSQRK